MFAPSLMGCVYALVYAAIGMLSTHLKYLSQFHVDLLGTEMATNENHKAH